MKSYSFRILATVLAVIMAFSCCAVMVSAGTPENQVRQYGKEGGYLAIGDSIGRGCGSDGFYMDRDIAADGGQYDIYELRNVEGSYPYLVAQAVGCEAPADITDQNATYWPLCYPGMTTAVAMDILGFEDNYSDTKLNYAYYDDVLKYFGHEGSYEGARGEKYVEGECGLCGNAVELVKKADLITVELGMCDIFYRAYRIISNGGFLADGLSFDLSNPEAIASLLTNAVSLMYEGFDNWATWYPVMIQKIQALNPDATIVMVGSFNLVNQMTLNDESAFPLGTVFSTITDAMNKNYEKWAKEFGVLYANVVNTETLATESDWSVMDEFLKDNNSFAGSHPSQNGHSYMARQILAQLPGAPAKEGIVIDLGRYEKVDYVLVNGQLVKDFEMNGYELFIPYYGTMATNLTVGIVNDDGTIGMQTYTLTYKQGEGYTSYRVYGNNDILGTIKKAFESIWNLLKKLIDAIKGIGK